MNFLKLCQEVNRFGGFQGAITSVNATGYQATLVAAVSKSWVEIQNERPDWAFLRRDVTVPVTSATTVYTPTDIFGSTVLLGTWDTLNVLYNYQALDYIPYEDYIRIDPTLSVGPPTYFSIRPEDNALLFNTLDGSYSVQAYYNRIPQVLTNNTDIPIIPEKHHWIIVYAALVEMASFISNPEVYARYSLLQAKAMGQLMRDQNAVKKVRIRSIC